MRTTLIIRSKRTHRKEEIQAIQEALQKAVGDHIKVVVLPCDLEFTIIEAE